MQMPAQRMSVADYLAMEERSQVRHEYVDGDLYALSGATRPHNLLVTNLCGLTWQARTAHRCQIFTQSMKVRVIAGNCFFYPDLVGSCDSTDDDERYVEHPCFVIEVLSPSTASMDRTEKRDAYLTLESLDEYVIVEQSQMRISVYRRLCRPWVAEVLDAPNDVLKLTCIRVGMALADIYEGVRFSQDVMRNYPVVRAPAITASEVQP